MKRKVLKISLYILGLILIFLLVLVAYFLITTSKYSLNKEKLIANQREIVYYDINNQQIENDEITQQKIKINELPENLINAFIAIEDKRFYKHNGIDSLGLLRAGINNVKSLSF